MNKLKIGSVVTCVVSGITDYGVFVKIDEEYTGLVHISEISDKYISNVDRLYIIGDKIDAKIIEIDEKKKQVKLSIKENKTKKRSKKKIEEKGEGFKPLKDNLDKWIKERIEELEKNRKNP